MRKSRDKLTKRIIDAAEPQSRRFVLWDSQLAGFGIRVTPAGVKTFILRYRPRGTSVKRYMTLGRWGPLTVDQARERTKEILGAVAAGKDPATDAASLRRAATLERVCAEFLSEHVAAKRKPRTAESYRHALHHHVLPKLGKRKIHEVTHLDIEKLHLGLASTPPMANYVVAVLASMFSWAARRGHLAMDHNPAKRIERYEEEGRERFLDNDEMLRLGAALHAAETTGIPWNVDLAKPTAKHAPKAKNRFTLIDPFAVAAIRLLTLSGCRVREILDLQWAHVDIVQGGLVLPASKTGRKIVLLGAPALQVLSSLPRVGRYVFPGNEADKPRADLKRPWTAIKKEAGLEGLRLHDLRHTFASVGANAGLGLQVVGKLLGHAQPRSTQRYFHFSEAYTRAASEQISEKIAAAMAVRGHVNKTEGGF